MMSRPRLLNPMVVARLAVAGLMLLPAGAALASQGPGIAPGTASAITQLAMAVIVYGGSALIVAAGLIGALRHR